MGLTLKPCNQGACIEDQGTQVAGPNPVSRGGPISAPARESSSAVSSPWSASQASKKSANASVRSRAAAASASGLEGNGQDDLRGQVRGDGSGAIGQGPQLVGHSRGQGSP